MSEPEQEPGLHASKDHPDVMESYTPTFSASTRKVIYLIGTIIAVLSGVATIIAATITAPAWITVAAAALNMAGGTLCGAFGVHYVGQSQ